MSNTAVNTEQVTLSSMARAYETAESVETAAAYTTVKVNGREVWSKFGGRVASVYQNGTVEFKVRGRSKGTQGSVFVKQGQVVTVEVF